MRIAWWLPVLWCITAGMVISAKTAEEHERAVVKLTSVPDWKLVRFLPEGSDLWHPVDDDLKGDAPAYGIPGSTLPFGSVQAGKVNGAWNRVFEEEVPCFDQFFITSVRIGYEQKYVWCPTHSVWNNDIPYSYTDSREIQMASTWGEQDSAGSIIMDNVANLTHIQNRPFLALRPSPPGILQN